MIQLMAETINAPISAAEKLLTVKPAIKCATNQKKIPFKNNEKSPKVKILSGSVNRLITGLIIMLMKIKQAATITAVIILLIEIPTTTYGRTKMVIVVINQRSKIILKK